jgi:hypothetical protein
VALALLALAVGLALLAAPAYVTPGPDAPDPEYRYTAVERVPAGEPAPTETVAYANLTPRGQRYVDRAIAAADGEYRVRTSAATLPSDYGDDTVAITTVVRDGTRYRVETGGDGTDVDLSPLGLPLLRVFGLLALLTGVEAAVRGANHPAALAAGTGVALLPVVEFGPEVVAVAAPLGAVLVGAAGYAGHLLVVAVRRRG